MSTIQRVLLIADGSRQRGSAFERTARLAQAAGACVHIALFDHSRAITLAALIDAPGATLARRQFLQEREAWVRSEALVMRGRTPELEVSADARWANHPDRDIIDLALDFRADLVVKQAHHDRELARSLFAPLDWRLLRECPCPVLLVDEASPPRPSRVFAAVDVSVPGLASASLNDRVIRMASTHAVQAGAELHLVYVFEAAELFSTLEEPMRTAFAGLAATHGVAPQARHFLVGNAEDELGRLTAGRPGDVVVIGTARHLGLDRIIMGRTAEAILDQVSCDVLAVKPEGFLQQAAKRRFGVGP